MSREEIKENNLYYTIIRGTFRVQVDKDNPDAIRRDYETSDGKTGTKYERIVNSLIGYIEDIQFRDGDFGMQIFIALDENFAGEKPVIALNTSAREAEDFMKKLPNINLLKEVRLRPFNFEGSEGDEVRGMEILQPDPSGEFNVKITNFFRDAEKKININGFPNPEGDTEGFSKDDWKIYFLQARKFLVAHTRDVMQAKVAQAVIDRGVATPTSKEQEDRLSNAAKAEGIDPDDIPF